MPRIQVPQQWISRLSKDDQIAELNSEVKCKLSVSGIHGVGVRALRKIQKDEQCFITPRMAPIFYSIPFGSLSKLFPEIKEIILQRWGSVVNGSIFRSPNDDAGLIFFVNHSEDPNYDILTDCAINDIAKGEEIFSNYKQMANYEKVWPDIDTWQNVTNVEQKKSWMSLSGVRHVRQSIKGLFKS